MKKNSKIPFSNRTTEEPIIRPLEQRRVPSATGAAFALPLPPEEADVLPVDEVPAGFGGEATVEGEVDPVFVVDPLPIDFDDVVDGVDAGVGEFVIDEGVVEEFNPDVIFYTLFEGGLGMNGEVIPFEGEVIGCGGIGDGLPLGVGILGGAEEIGDGGMIDYGSAFDDNGDIIVFEGGVIGCGGIGDGLPLEGEILGGDEGIGDGEVIGEVPAFIDKDGDGHDDVTGESLEVPIYVTNDMLKDSDGAIFVHTSANGGGINPEIYYSAAGGPAPTAGGDPEVTPDTAGVDHSPASAHHDVAEHAPAVTAAQGSSVEIAFAVDSATPSVVLPASSGHEITPFDGVNVPATPVSDFGSISHDFAAHEFPVAPVVFGSTSVDPVSAGFEATHGDFAVDAWVPVISASTEIVTHVDVLSAETAHEHAEVVAPADAGAAALQDHTLHSGAAMAATGAALLSRDPKKREDKEQA